MMCIVQGNNKIKKILINFADIIGRRKIDKKEYNSIEGERQFKKHYNSMEGERQLKTL